MSLLWVEFNKVQSYPLLMDARDVHQFPSPDRWNCTNPTRSKWVGWDCIPDVFTWLSYDGFDVSMFYNGLESDVLL